MFWKTCFLGKEQVDFQDFAVQFFDQFPSLKGKLPKPDEAPIMSGYVGEIKGKKKERQFSIFLKIVFFFLGSLFGKNSNVASDATERVLQQVRMSKKR